MAFYDPFKKNIFYFAQKKLSHTGLEQDDKIFSFRLTIPFKFNNFQLFLTLKRPHYFGWIKAN